MSLIDIKPQPCQMGSVANRSCVISFFYIKPQPLSENMIALTVVLYLSSTSNHNYEAQKANLRKLCYIFLLHQTTTPSRTTHRNTCCVISFFYIKPQLSAIASFTLLGCVISFFYIKPQRKIEGLFQQLVVLYLSSTSNHNTS